MELLKKSNGNLPRTQKEVDKMIEKAAKAAAKQSAQDKLKALGLSDSEIAAITGGI